MAIPVIRACWPAGVGDGLGMAVGDANWVALGTGVADDVGATVGESDGAVLTKATEGGGLEDALPDSIPDAPIPSSSTRATTPTAAAAAIIRLRSRLPPAATVAGVPPDGGAPAPAAPTAGPGATTTGATSVGGNTPLPDAAPGSLVPAGPAPPGGSSGGISPPVPPAAAAATASGPSVVPAPAAAAPAEATPATAAPAAAASAAATAVPSLAAASRRCSATKAAPSAIESFGCVATATGRPVDSRTISATSGIRDDPPTSRMPSRSPNSSPALCAARPSAATLSLIRGRINSSKSCRVRRISVSKPGSATWIEASVSVERASFARRHSSRKRSSAATVAGSCESTATPL
jgi:hypothetical protein